MIDQKEKQKSSLLENFNVSYLEEMLKSTTKSIAKDVVSTLINTERSGVLVNMQKREKSMKGSDTTGVPGISDPEKIKSMSIPEKKKVIPGRSDFKS